MGLLGILLGLAVLVGLSFRSWTVLVLAPLAAMVAALFAGDPLLAHWTQTFMGRRPDSSPSSSHSSCLVPSSAS